MQYFRISVTLKSKNDTAVSFLDFELAKEQEDIMLITKLLQKTDYHWLMDSLTFIKYSNLEKIFVKYDNGASVGEVGEANIIFLVSILHLHISLGIFPIFLK